MLLHNNFFYKNFKFCFKEKIREKLGKIVNEEKVVPLSKYILRQAFSLFWLKT
jgi:hypothetical protein